MAFARAKMHWAKMNAKKMMTEGRPKGKEHCRPKLYYDGVLEGSRLVAEQCTKDISLNECTHFILSCKMKQVRYAI